MQFYDKLKKTLIKSKTAKGAGAGASALLHIPADASAISVKADIALEPAYNVYEPAETPEDSEQRMMFIVLEAASGAREYAYLMFDAIIEKDVTSMFSDHRAIHPYAAVIYSGDGDPSAQVKEHIQMLYGFDTDQALQRQAA